MSTRTIAAVMILIGILIAVTYDKKQVMAPVPSDEGVVCTQEAKQCPDGSYVSRTGPQCQFADCPVVVTPQPTLSTATIKGSVFTSPSCGGPEMVPPRDGCGPRAFQTSIDFVGAKKTYTTSVKDTGGYSILLPAGTYTVQAKGGDPYPICFAEVVTLKSAQSLTKDIICDSGIR